MKRLFLIFLVLFSFSAPCWGDWNPYIAGIVESSSDGTMGSIDHTGSSFQLNDTGVYHQDFTPTTAGAVNYLHVHTGS